MNLLLAILVCVVSLSVSGAPILRAEHIETMKIGCNTCTKHGPGSWSCTTMGCVDQQEVEDWERKKAAHAQAPAATVSPAGKYLQFSLTGALKITRESFDALLKDYPQAKLRVEVVPSRCEEQMRSAMKAVDGFVDPDSVVYAVTVEDMYEGMKLWQRVKAECWKEQP